MTHIYLGCKSDDLQRTCQASVLWFYCPIKDWYWFYLDSLELWGCWPFSWAFNPVSFQVMKTKWHFLVLEHWNICINSSHMKIHLYAEMPSWYLASWLLIVRVSRFYYFSLCGPQNKRLLMSKNPILMAQNKE